MKTCPHCAESIQDAALVCKHCNREVAAAKPKGRIGTLAGLAIIIAAGVVISWCAASTDPSAPASSAGTPAASSALVSRRKPTAPQLAELVTKNGDRCPTAKRTFLQGVDAESETWNVECSTGSSYTVMLKNSGEVKTLDCAVLKSTVHVECFKTYDEQKAR